MYQGTGSSGCLAPRYYQGPFAEAVPKRGDPEIRGDLERALQLDPWVDEKGVAVEVKQGVVTLSGEVDVMNEKRAAGDDAWDTPGVIDVNNNLRIRKAERLSRPRREAPMAREGLSAGQGYQAPSRSVRR